MTLPTVQDLYAVSAVTWPAAQVSRTGPWTIRSGLGGGSRVSAATAEAPFDVDDLSAAITAMTALRQHALFMVRNGEVALDLMLAAQGYAIKDPVNLYVVPLAALTTERPSPVTSFQVWPPLASQVEIWAAGGIGAARLAVMDRAPMPKTTLLGRVGDRPAGTVYIGVHAGIAMVHALEILPAFRRQGLAGYLTRAAGFWAADNGATHLALIVTQANAAANTLYTSLGMTLVGQYHYRIRPE